MDEFKTDEAAELPEGAAALPRWTGTPYIELAHHLNAQCVELVCELAVSPHQTPPPFVLQNLDLWRLLEPEARRRAAAFPFVVVDLRFKDGDWWRETVEKLAMNPADLAPAGRIEPKFFEDLALETLLFARQSAREDVVVAKALFAMASDVASLVATLTLPQVRAIALSNSQHLRVRWDNDPEFWGELLVACRAEDQQAMDTLRRQGKLLFCGELVPKSAQPRRSDDGQQKPPPHSK